MPLKKLTTQEKLFVAEYLATSPLNPEKAAIAAGYAPSTAKSQAYTWASNNKGVCPKNKKHVLASINRRLKATLDKLEVTKEKVLAELTKLGFSSIDNHVKIDDDGCVIAKTFDEMGSDALAAIKKVKHKRTIKGSATGGKEDDIILENTFEFELYDKLMALKTIGDHLGMFKQHLIIEDDSGIIERLQKGRERVNGIEK